MLRTIIAIVILALAVPQVSVYMEFLTKLPSTRWSHVPESAIISFPYFTKLYDLLKYQTLKSRVWLKRWPIMEA